MYAVPSGPTSLVEPCRPLPVPLLPAGESWLGLPNDAPPFVDTDTITGSLPLPVRVADRNSVQLKYTRPKNGLEGVESTEIQFLSLKSTEEALFVPITGADQVTPLSSEWLTMMNSKPFFPTIVARDA